MHAIHVRQTPHTPGGTNLVQRSRNTKASGANLRCCTCTVYTVGLAAKVPLGLSKFCFQLKHEKIELHQCKETTLLLKY